MTDSTQNRTRAGGYPLGRSLSGDDYGKFYASYNRTVSGANRETKRAEPQETSSASLPVLVPSLTALSSGAHTSGASVGLGDERSESSGESISALSAIFRRFRIPDAH